MMPLRVFWSYSHRDRNHLARIKEAFAERLRNNEIESWDDGEIRPGEPWEPSILRALEKANVVLLLVSNSFLASEECRKEARAAEARIPDGVAVVPVLLSQCDWEAVPLLRRLQGLPRDFKPLRNFRWHPGRLKEVVQGVAGLASRAVSHAPSPSTVRGVVPDALPHLCNRDEQEEVLRRTIVPHIQHRPDRPFVCIVHGDESELPMGYFRRLCVDSLPQHLDLGEDGEVRDTFAMDWPHEGYTPADAADWFWYILASSLGLGSRSVPDELASMGRPVVLYTTLLESEWKNGGEAWLRAYLQFWDAFPALPPASGAGTRIIALLIVRYSSAREEAPSPDAESDREGIDRTLQEVQRELSAARYPGLSGVVLPALAPVPRRAVENLAGKRRVQRACPLNQHVDEWNAEVESFFGDRRFLPMKEVTVHLRERLPKYARRG